MGRVLNSTKPLAAFCREKLCPRNGRKDSCAAQLRMCLGFVLPPPLSLSSMLAHACTLCVSLSYLETSSQRGPLRVASRKVASISDRILMRARVSSRGHRLPAAPDPPPPPLPPASPSMSSSGSRPRRRWSRRPARRSSSSVAAAAAAAAVAETTPPAVAAAQRQGGRRRSMMRRRERPHVRRHGPVLGPATLVLLHGRRPTAPPPLLLRPERPPAGGGETTRAREARTSMAGRLGSLPHLELRTCRAVQATSRAIGEAAVLNCRQF